MGWIAVNFGLFVFGTIQIFLADEDPASGGAQPASLFAYSCSSTPRTSPTATCAGSGSGHAGAGLLWRPEQQTPFSPPSNLTPMQGEVIAGRYELLELIGKGGMSSVYKAHDRLLDRQIAVKILHPHFTEDEEYVERFRREARAVAQLSHPNIVTVIDRGEDEGGSSSFSSTSRERTSSNGSNGPARCRSGTRSCWRCRCARRWHSRTGAG